MLNLEINACPHGFRVLKEGDIPGLSAHFWQLRHEATGATLYYTTRDDGQKVFSVGFRTLPEDDTGVFHILEHSCLDGSEHFPLKEPFVNLIKTSMAVDLNAMTYEDKTVYFFITTNEQDYMNLMSVYLDAVFHPLLLSDRRIFEKEAWHLEPDGVGGVAISGVVFNEMQGRENQPDYILWMQNMKQLFPDLPFHTCNSGGDPLAIPDLSYEQFVETYKRFYSTQNAIFYLSGEMDLARELAYIDGVLSDKGVSSYEKPAPAPLQSPVVSPDGEVYYQLAETEELEGNTHLMITYALAPEKPEEKLAFSLLSRYLAENTESPLERAVLAADVGQDFTMGIDFDYRQPMVYFTMGKSDPDCAEPFRRVILDTLSALVSEGLDHDRLADLVALYETDNRRNALSVQVGFSLMEAFMRTHVIYDDFAVFDDLALLRARMTEDERYFEHLLETYILGSDHWALTKCIPSRTLSAERQEKMLARFAAEAEHVRGFLGGYDALIANNEAFNEYLTAPDSPEAEATVPHLSPTDVTDERQLRDMEVETISVENTDVPSLFYEADADGITLAGLIFDLSAIPEEDLFYVACLSDALFGLPTEAHSLPELTRAWARLRTNPGVDLRVEINSRAYLEICLDTPVESLAGAAALLQEYLQQPLFDRDTLRRIFANASSMRNRMIRRGNNTALRLASRTLTVTGRYHDEFSGLSAYRRYAELADRFDACADALIEGLRRVWTTLTRTVRPLSYLIGSRDAYAVWKQSVAALSMAAAVPAESPDRRPMPLPRKNIALTIPGNVNYCAEVFDLADVGATFTPRMQVVNNLLFSVYFWDEIRAKGGAYGANATAFRQGIAALTSYRDPRVGDTYAVYDHLPDWLEEHIPEDADVDALIMSVIGSSYFAPAGPLGYGQQALGRFLIGRTVADRSADLQAVLSTTPADFRAYADLVHRLSGKGVRAVVGNAEIIRRSGLFAEDEMVEL